jgi:hypothetical protein
VRDTADWRVEPPRIYTDPRQTEREKQKTEETAKKNKKTHYKPRGDRSTWTEAQYTVYKEEKARFQSVQWKSRKVELETMAKDILGSKPKWTWIMDGGRNKGVLAVIDGREDGEPPVQKNARGLPLSVKLDDDTSPGEEDAKDGENESSATPENSVAEVATDQPTEHADVDESSEGENLKQKGSTKKRPSESSESSESEQPTKSSKPVAKKARGRKSNKPWVIPDASEDEGDGYDEVAFMREQGLTIVHDYWPSMWRSACAAHVSMQRINKTVSLGVVD